VNMGKSSAKICVPFGFGAESIKCDRCAVETATNYSARTGTRKNTLHLSTGLYSGTGML